ncbi:MULTISPECIES: helix-turn-helix transcriptional regulator [unclassified Bradyrhizobium]|uniref:helix-turn-helix transcriptional regulator n=1 Tax=unclassified Bradyrhizobium TaxID=2631580 RepID=UPI0028E3CE19|nr:MULTISPECIES: helix-turn-helix transcriptional regulator [unclassified Bradyrhizobium]
MTINISDLFPDLTRKQREVCALLVKGYSHKEAAIELRCSPRTIEDHLQEILRKTKAYDSRRLIYKVLGSPEVIA